MFDKKLFHFFSWISTINLNETVDMIWMNLFFLFVEYVYGFLGNFTEQMVLSQQLFNELSLGLLMLILNNHIYEERLLSISPHENKLLHV